MKFSQLCFAPSSQALTNDRFQKDSTSCLSFLLAASMRLGNRLYECLLGATQDCENSTLELGKKAEETALLSVTSCDYRGKEYITHLGFYVALGASQDLETEMCDEGRKGRRAPSACEGRVIAC
ncbi:MAG: hypothetical protein PWP09_1724, partial [Thermotogota bacterium]|nr:hypothetical protein [Thermotogota bacterium]